MHVLSLEWVKMIKRETYLEKLRVYRNKPVIKVLTGLRRAGKSSLLLLLRDELLEAGVKPEQIIHVNFDSMAFFDLREPKALYRHLKEKMAGNTFSYVLIDEIQEAQGWEQVVNSLLSEGGSDLYVTGSNSQLLSSDLATYIAGRYVEIPVSTLSFEEALSFRRVYAAHAVGSMAEEMNRYIRTGGFPALYLGEYDYPDMYRMVKDIYASAVLRDVVQRLNLRNVELLERILRFVFDNIGNIFSTRNVTAYFLSQHRKVDQSTVFHYLSALSDAFIINRIRRYDVKGKEILQTNEKYYLGDISLVHAAFGYQDRLIAGVLENIVLLELQRRGYEVFVGKAGEKEIDFVAVAPNHRIYVQVAFRISEMEKTATREFAPLLALADQYPKYVVTMDEVWQDNVEGVKHVPLSEFLLMKQYG